MIIHLYTKNKTLFLGIISLIIIFIIDIMLPLGIAVGILYMFCLIIVSDLSKKTILVFGSISIILTLSKLFVFYQSGDTNWLAIPNRLITVFTLIVTIWIVLLRKHTLNTNEKIKAKNLSLLIENNNNLEELQQAIDSHLTISITDLNGKIIFANKNFCDLYDYPLEEIIGKTHQIVNSGHHPKETFDEMWKTITNGEVWIGELKNKNRKGDYYWAETVNIPIKDKEGQIIKYLCSRRDITENVYLKEKSIKEKKDLEHFAYIATHDLKSPILNLELLLDHLQELNTFDVDGQFIMNNIINSVKKIQETIENLNEVLKHKKNINDFVEKLSLKNEFEVVLKSVEQNLKNKDIFINYDFNENTIIYFSKIQLHSIFLNFLTNSIKYRRKDIQTRIQVRSRCVDNKIQLAFKDNGLGIDLDRQKDNLYGLFKRFHNTNEEGKGIGLHLVKHIIDNNDGNIKVKSKLNHGTTFFLSFNCAKIKFDNSLLN